MQTFIRIVDNKKVCFTQSEFDLYTKICRSYDRPNFKGEELFKDLFETDNDGIILFLIPPSKNYSSIEVFMFLIALFQQQHTRLMYNKVSGIAAEMHQKLSEIDQMHKELTSKIRNDAEKSTQK